MNIPRITGAMNIFRKIYASSLFIFGLFFPVYGSVYADVVQQPGWFTDEAGPVSHEEAVQSLANSVEWQQITRISLKDVASEASDVQEKSATTVDSRIADLAHGLHNDPKLIFDYVHNHIDYVPYFGSLKGAMLTLLDGSGNDFDQAALLIALLRHSGYTAQFVFGKMTIQNADLANWIGVDNNAQLIGNMLASGGIPVSYYSSYALVDRVWVKVVIDGSAYLLDPAWKVYSEINGIDISEAIGYNRAALLASATNGATVTTSFSQHLNASGLATNLASYSSALINSIKSLNSNASVQEVIGGRAIVQEQLEEYSPSLPFPTSDEVIWNEVPNNYTATMRIRHMGIDKTYIIPDIAGKRLTLTYDASFRPRLALDGTVVATGNAVATDTPQALEVFVNHPYVAQNSRYMDQGASNDSSFCLSGSHCLAPYMVKRSGTYALITDFGDTSDTQLGYRQQQLNQFLENGQTETSEPVLGETLNIIGLTWMKECLLADRIAAELAETRSVKHHRMGVMAQEGGYYIDVKVQAMNSLSRHNITADKTAYFYAFGLLFSSLEHGVLEQMMGSDKPGVSTIKLLHIANTSGQPVFWANSSTFNGVKPSLQNYSSNDLNTFQNLVNAGHTLVLPRNGNQSLGQWTGKAYIDRYETGTSRSIGMIIGGDYNGGYSASQEPTNPPAVNNTAETTYASTAQPATINQTVNITPTVTSQEPVDMASGSYLYDHTDLMLGSNSPMGLSFQRSYSSSRRLQKVDNNGFGYGWAHNYNIRLEEGSDGNPGLGQRTPVDMAPMIAALWTSLDLLKSENNIKGWMVSCLASKWAIDRLIDNVVTIHMGSKNMQFVKLPNGTFVSPPGITATLTKSGDSYTLQERFGLKMVFAKVAEKKYRITTLRDADGNQTTFSYTNDKLTTVANTFGHRLSLGYNGERISSVSDSSGRTVSYGYTGKDLTSVTDPDQKVSSFGYDSSHRMTTLKNPLNITTATNSYNSQSQVIHQTVPRQSGGNVTYDFYFSGFRNAEEDPDNQKLIYYCNYSASKVDAILAMKSGCFPWKSSRKASDAETPCFLQVER